MPIGRPRVQFNGQRVFSTSEILKLFKGLTLKAFSFVDNMGHFIGGIEVDSIVFNENLGSDFALGCFVFKKERS